MIFGKTKIIPDFQQEENSGPSLISALMITY